MRFKIVNLTSAGLVLILLLALLSGCAPAATAAPTLMHATPTHLATPGDLFQSDGGGEPRSPGYWLLWNSCAVDNRSAVATANGGRTAGYVILDDLLIDPGLTLADLPVETCQQGVDLLSRRDLDGQERSSDAAYQLAQSLLAAQLNLFVGSETCPAAEQAVLAGHLLLSALNFNGKGDYRGALSDGNRQETADILVGQLEAYNNGSLCR